MEIKKNKYQENKFLINNLKIKTSKKVSKEFYNAIKQKDYQKAKDIIKNENNKSFYGGLGIILLSFALFIGGTSYITYFHYASDMYNLLMGGFFSMATIGAISGSYNIVIKNDKFKRLNNIFDKEIDAQNNRAKIAIVENKSSTNVHENKNSFNFKENPPVVNTNIINFKEVKNKKR